MIGGSSTAMTAATPEDAYVNVMKTDIFTEKTQ
jgi:hypothetical protein